MLAPLRWCCASVCVCRRQDFKQLPPATGHPPFIVVPIVTQTFEFRCLTENRRVIADTMRQAELNTFHTVLNDISMGVASNEVRSFLIEAYVRGARVGNAENVSFEGSTAVFTKRRYRDRWNRVVTRRVSRRHNHSLKIKGMVRARGTRSHQWYPDSRVNFIRRMCRTQSLFQLHLAGTHSACFVS